MTSKSENQIQADFFRWCDALSRQYPELDLFHSIPNGTNKTRFSQRLHKLTGLKSGVPDTFLPAAKCGYYGLYIEFKSETGRLSPNQKVWIAKLISQNYIVLICRNWVSASEITTAYLKDDLRGFLEKAESHGCVPELLDIRPKNGKSFRDE